MLLEKVEYHLPKHPSSALTVMSNREHFSLAVPIKNFHTFWKDDASHCHISTSKALSRMHVFIPSDDAKFLSGYLMSQVFCGFTGCLWLGMWCVNANPEIYIINSSC